MHPKKYRDIDKFLLALALTPLLAHPALAENALENQTAAKQQQEQAAEDAAKDAAEKQAEPATGQTADTSKKKAETPIKQTAEEMVVTATRSEENIREIPTKIEVIDSHDIEMTAGTITSILVGISRM